MEPAGKLIEQQVREAVAVNIRARGRPFYRVGNFVVLPGLRVGREEPAFPGVGQGVVVVEGDALRGGLSAAFTGILLIKFIPDIEAVSAEAPEPGLL
jgi:hypothetical protein